MRLIDFLLYVNFERNVIVEICLKNVKQRYVVDHMRDFILDFEQCLGNIIFKFYFILFYSIYFILFYMEINYLPKIE